MTRWRYCVVLAMLLLWPLRTEGLDDEDDDGTEENEESDTANEDEDDDGDEQAEKAERPGRRTPPPSTTPKTVATRTTKKRPLDCYVCAYKSETPTRNCLDPTKYRVNTITCHSNEDKCFTSVVSKGTSLESVVRGCRSGCVGSPDTTCCELNRCNSQPFAMPVVPAARMRTTNNAKTLQPTVVLFVTVLLLLQTVVKVSFV